MSTVGWHEGATPAEQQALYNNCRFVLIIKDCDYAGRLRWRTQVGTKPCDGGFEWGVDVTRKEALASARTLYPSLEIWVEHGAGYTLKQPMAAKLQD